MQPAAASAKLTLPGPVGPALLRVVRAVGRRRTIHAARRHRRLEEHTDELDTPRQRSSTIKVKIAARRAQPVGASITSSVLNLANTNMGVGMLALPSAMASAGVLGGICLLLLSATIANPRELAIKLIGADVKLVDRSRDGSPSGERWGQ